MFKRLSTLDSHYAGSHDGGKIPYLHFSEEAQALFSDFHGRLERHLRAQKESPAMEAHLSKFRGLIPSLALIFHLCETEAGPVSKEALLKALRFAKCLQSHAQRIYSFAEKGDLYAAQRLAERIKSGAISNEFTCREVYRKNWQGLAREDVECATELLVDARWIVACKQKTSGRGKVSYFVNPKVSVAEEFHGDHPCSSSGIWSVGD